MNESERRPPDAKAHPLRLPSDDLRPKQQVEQLVREHATPESLWDAILSPSVTVDVVDYVLHHVRQALEGAETQPDVRETELIASTSIVEAHEYALTAFRNDSVRHRMHVQTLSRYREEIESIFSERARGAMGSIATANYLRYFRRLENDVKDACGYARISMVVPGSNVTHVSAGPRSSIESKLSEIVVKRLNESDLSILQALVELEASGETPATVSTITSRAGGGEQKNKEATGALFRHGLLDKGPKGHGFLLSEFGREVATRVGTSVGTD